jgi:tetratricopeptide (TPR) repeat protein
MTGPDALSVERARLLTGLAFARHWRISFSEKDFFAATRAGEEAWRIANALDDAVEMNAALDALSSIQAEQGDVPGALEVTRKRLELSDRLDVTEQSDTLDMLARYTAQLGEYRLALRYEKEAGDLVGKLRLYEWDLTSVWVSIMILLQWDRWAEASAKIAQFIGTEVPVKLRSWSRESFPTLGRIAAALGVLRGDEEEGLRIARAAQRIRVEGEDVNRSFRASHERVYLIQVLIALGRFGEAEDALREHEQSAMHPETGLEAALLRAECAAALGNTDARTLGTAVEVRIQAWDRPRRARVGRAIGVGCAAAGEFEEATHRLEGALGLFKAIDTAWQQGRTLVAMGEVWERSGQPARAKERYEEAVASFELVGARRDSEATRARLEIGSRAS